MSGGVVGRERAALSILRTLGAGKASLLVPQPAVAAGQTGLGLIAPLASEVELEPVLLHSARNGQTLYAVTTRCTVQEALNLAGCADSGESTTKETLETSMLRAGGTDYRVVSVTVKWISGAELLYQLEIEE
jgi:hypothetical protein